MLIYPLDCAGKPTPVLEYEQNDQRDNQSKKRDRFGQGKAQNDATENRLRGAGITHSAGDIVTRR